MTKKRTYIGRLWRSTLRGALDGVPVVSQLLAVNDDMKRRKAEEEAAGKANPFRPDEQKEVEPPTMALPRVAVSLGVVLLLVYAVHRGLIPVEQLFDFIRLLLAK